MKEAKSHKNVSTQLVRLRVILARRRNYEPRRQLIVLLQRHLSAISPQLQQLQGISTALRGSLLFPPPFPLCWPWLCCEFFFLAPAIPRATGRAGTRPGAWACPCQCLGAKTATKPNKRTEPQSDCALCPVLRLFIGDASPYAPLVVISHIETVRGAVVKPVTVAVVSTVLSSCLLLSSPFEKNITIILHLSTPRGP